MHKLTQPKAFKIVFDASIEGFQKLLCVKQQLGEDFYVRYDGMLTRFIVGFSEKHLSKLSPESDRLCDEIESPGFCADNCSIMRLAT